MIKNYLPLDNSQVIKVGPFISDIDGKTLVTDLVLALSDVKISKNDAVFISHVGDIEAPVLTYDANGYYQLTLSATDNDTVGKLIVSINATGCLPFKATYEVRNRYIIRISHTGNGVTVPDTGDTLVYDGENLNIYADPDGSDQIVSLAIDGESASLTLFNNIDDTLDRYMVFENVCKSHKVAIGFGAGA